MRIWDVDPSLLCKSHLLGEHRELHGCWNILVHGKKGYSQHPETKRWVGKLPALKKRHDALVEEMKRRWARHEHKTELPVGLAGAEYQEVYVDTPERQIELLKAKGCGCKARIEAGVVYA